MEDNGAPCLYGVFLDALERLHGLYMAAEKLELVERVPVPAATPEPPRRQRTVAEAMAAALDDVL
jgi:hypothetical protein